LLRKLYNYFRDYDPQTGRYIESDPIGLRGGSASTYSYVNNNPISNVDPRGLESGYALESINRAEGFPSHPPSEECPSCQESDRWSYTPPAVCGSGDAMCGIAMQAAGIPGPYYSTTHVVSRKCVLTFLVLLKPAGYGASNLVARQIALGTVILRPAIGELGALALTGPGSIVVAVPFAMDEIIKKCSCDK
jgi:hypothetical protein